jgi:hypothetical protein
VRGDLGLRYRIGAVSRSRRSEAVAVAVGAWVLAGAAPTLAAAPAAPGALLVRERPPCKLQFNLPSFGPLYCDSGGAAKLAIRSPSGRLMRRYRIGRHVELEGAAMSPDGRSIAVLAGKGNSQSTGVLLVRVSDGKRRWLVRPHGRLYFATPAWSPDSTKVLYGRTFVEQRVVDVRTGADARVSSPAVPGGQIYLVFLPNGDVLAAAQPDSMTSVGEVTQFVGLPLSGAPMTPISAEFHQSQPPGPADISPDGQSIAYLADAKLWIVALGGEPRLLATAPAGVREGAIQWSPDGTRLAVRWDVLGQVGVPMVPRSRAELFALDGSRVRLPVDPSNSAQRIDWSGTPATSPTTARSRPIPRAGTTRESSSSPPRAASTASAIPATPTHRSGSRGGAVDEPSAAGADRGTDASPSLIPSTPAGRLPRSAWNRRSKPGRRHPAGVAQSVRAAES